MTSISIRILPALLGILLATTSPLGAELITARDTGGDSFRWDNEDSWSPSVIPDGVGVAVRVDKDEGEDRNINLGPSGNTGGFTLTRFFSTIEVEFRNRVRRGSLRFEAPAGGDAEIHVDGSGGGRLEFRMDESAAQAVFLASDLHTYVAADHPDTELRFRGNLSGPGGLHLHGLGEVRFRVSDLTPGSALEPYTYTGPTVINRGVLRLRQADLTGTPSIMVRPGGQLRLDARLGGEPDGLPMNVAYTLGGGPITLAGMGRDDANPNLGGPTGALRQQGRGTQADIATLNNEIILAEDAAIHTNSEVDAGGSVLRLTGPIRGPGMLFKTGGGTLELSGENTSGGLLVENGTVEILAPGALQNIPLIFRSRSDTRTLVTRHDHTVTMLDGTAPDPDLGEANTLFLRLGDGTTFTVDVPFALQGDDEADMRFQGEISGAADFVKTGPGSLRFTRFAKTLTGATTIAEGVLELSASSALAQSSRVSVESGGQLRLTTSGDPAPAEYNFGGPLELRGMGRTGLSDDRGLGMAGALRYDPGSGVSAAVLRSPVVIAENAGIHVNGGTKTLELAGALSGPGTIVRSGAGALVVSGAGSLTGGLNLTNGITRLLNGATTLGGGPLIFSDETADARLELAGGTHTVNDLAGTGARSSLSIEPGATLVVDLLPAGRPPFEGGISGGGTLIRRGSGSLTLAGTLNGLADVRMEGGRTRLLNGASTIGRMEVFPGAEFEVSGALDTAPLIMNGRWLLESGSSGTTVFLGSDTTVGGEIEVAVTGGGSAHPLLRFGANLSFQPGARLVVNTGGVGLPGDGLALLDVEGTLGGLENLSLLVDGQEAGLEFSNGRLRLMPGPGSIDEALLEALLGPFVFASGGYFTSAWLDGFFTPVFDADSRWIFHEAHRWWWVEGLTDADGRWAFDFDLGWVWTGPDFYPLLYRAGDAAWLYFGGTSGESRSFFRFAEPTGWVEFVLPFGG